MESTFSAKYVVIGGGIAGVTCAETLSALVPDKILLVTASSLIKAVVNYQKLTKNLETFDVEEKPVSKFEESSPNIQVLQKVVVSLDSSKCELTTTDGMKISYEKLCICSGGKPKLIAKENPNILGIRDTESVAEFQKKLYKAKRIVVVGNGGIATELVHEVEGCEVVWAVRDNSIASTFVDAGAASFFLPHLNQEKTSTDQPLKRLKYTLEDPSSVKRCENTMGGALGPDWANERLMVGSENVAHCVHVEYSVEVQHVYSAADFCSSGLTAEIPSLFQTSTQSDQSSWPVYIELTNGKLYGCDFIVSATGVVPNTQPFLKGNSFHTADDGGIKVNQKMETTVPDVYAAGDVCTASWDVAPHWLQMRLWSQARQMGCYAAKCMVAAINKEDVIMDFCFELFAHVTKFFNYKVVLLGKFNAQDLGPDHELLLRVTKGEEYVKAVLQNGRLKGAILIGETDMEETFENLILNEMDLTPFKDNLLNPNIDVEDFFD